MKNMNKYENCLLCPRKCGINRRTGQTGVCGVSSEIKVRAQHFITGRSHAYQEKEEAGQFFSQAAACTACSARTGRFLTEKRER